MDTVKIGNRFEEKVFKLFTDELVSGRLPFRADACSVFKKKGYYSKDRQKEIVVDVSIEARLPDQEQWSILMAIECKDYGQAVPVNDVEEFYAELQQIAGANVKGVVVSSKRFQEGALKYARSKGIALVRILDNNSFKWILTRAATGFASQDPREESETNIYRGLVDENYTSDNIDFYANISDKFTHSAWRLVEFLVREITEQDGFQALTNSQISQDTRVPFIPLEEIEDRSSQILKSVGYKQSEFDIEAHCEHIEKTSDLTIQFLNELGRDPLGFEILGKISFAPTIIHVSRGAHTNIFSRKFTLAHELGHYHLNHSKYLRNEYYSDEDLERDVCSSVTVSDIRRMEWQANHFASCLLLPRQTFLAEFQQLLSSENVQPRGHGVFFVDDQVCNLNTFYKITNKLRESFRVSRKVIEIRLKDLQLLNDARKLHKS